MTDSTWPTATEEKINFWVVCREDTSLTRKLAKTLAGWNLPGVRVAVGHRMPLSVGDAIARSNYAMFVTLQDEPGAGVSLSPVTVREGGKGNSPAGLLCKLGNRHGRVPQAWWMQLPTVEVRSHGLKPLSDDQILSQAICQIERYIRTYHLQPMALQSSSAPPSIDPARDHPLATRNLSRDAVAVEMSTVA